jgi:hypothetical protein
LWQLDSSALPAPARYFLWVQLHIRYDTQNHDDRNSGILEPFAFFDPALIKQVDDAGIMLNIAGAAKQSVNVRPLPAP